MVVSDIYFLSGSLSAVRTSREDGHGPASPARQLPQDIHSEMTHTHTHRGKYRVK